MWEDKIINNLHVARFNLNKGSKLPLHDHPDKTGVIYMLEGKCRIKSYHIEKQVLHITYLKLVKDRVLEKDEYDFLTPEVNYIHSFEAVEDCRMWEVFSPPYPVDEEETTYYQIYKIDEETGFFMANQVSVYDVEFPPEFMETGD